jgi:4-methylaminobutanoate oxidase (formaldehyde-forming)
VSLFDVSSFSKLEVKGANAEGLMQRLCCADVSPRDRCVYTGMLNERGGYESDCTVTRTGPETFMVVSPTAQGTRDADWIRRHLPEGGGGISVSDVTGSLSVLAVMGPQSRDLLQRLTSVPLDNESFPFGASREAYLGYVALRASRVTYVGELGWELYVPSECALMLYEQLHEAAASAPGAELRDCGYFAIDTLRIEKGYRAWGHELGLADTPLEAGLGFTVDWSKEFIGKAALAEQKAQGAAGLGQRVVSLHTQHVDLPIWGSEPIMRNGEVVGNVTSAGYAPSAGGQVAMGYVAHADAGQKGFIGAGSYHIDVGGTLLPATASLRGVFDPKNRRVHGDYTA